jgi:hypothetical protein
VVRITERDALRAHLRAAGIGTGIHYPFPVHQQPAYRARLACGPLGLGVTERAAPQILSLPIYPQLSAEAADRVVTEIRAFLGRQDRLSAIFNTGEWSNTPLPMSAMPASCGQPKGSFIAKVQGRPRSRSSPPPRGSRSRRGFS